MAACTNNGGSIAKRAVTAALVGVLSVGTVPMVALAEGVSDGIQTMAADWSTGATVTAAEDGKGSVFTGDLSKLVSFELGTGKYLVPTEITNQNGSTTDIVDAGLTLTYCIPAGGTATNADGTYNGFYNGNGVYLIDGEGTGVPINASGNSVTVSSDVVASYFAGTLTDTTGHVVHPIAGNIDVYASDGTTSKKIASFSVADEDPFAGAYVYATSPDDKEIVYTGSALNLKIANADGERLLSGAGDYKKSSWYKADGSSISYSDIKDAGDYTVVLKKADDSVLARINFTVQQYDISKNGNGFDDVINGSGLSTGTTAQTNFLTEVLGGNYSTFNGTNAYEITDVTAPSGAKGFNGEFGEYTVTVKATGKNVNCIGERTYKFSNLNRSLFSDTSMGIYYGSMNTTSGVSINLTKGESFDASQVKVRKTDGSSVYAGDQLELSYTDEDGKAVDASALKEAGVYTVTVRVKPFQDQNDWVGGTKTFTVTVSGDEAYGNNVQFYVDGELAKTSDSIDYDGTDLLGRISASVANPAGGSFEAGKDFTLEATKDGKAVDSVTDAGEYKIVVKPLTFKFNDGVDESEYTFTLTVNPLKLTVLKDFTYQEPKAATETEPAVDYVNDAVAWTGSAVEVPAVQYKNADGDLVTLDKSLYNVVSIKDESGKVVKEAADEGTYTVRIALSDAAKSNYSLADREFDFQVVKYGPFDDVKSPAWYASVVADAKFTGIVNGMSGTNLFAPEAQISRADAVCIIFNMAGGDNALDDNMYTENSGWLTGFSDVDGNAYYAKALAWAHNAGVVNGYDGAFRPTDKVTREELAAMLANYAKATGDYEATDGTALAGMSDASTVSDWAKGVVDWAVENGIMGNGGYVAGQSSIIRAEVAAMAVNYAGKF